MRVPDLELAVAYYTEVVGLVETARDGDRVFLKGWDELQHHSLILSSAPTYGLNSAAFKVVELPELDRLARRVEAAGSRPPRASRPVSSLRAAATSCASGLPAGTSSTSSRA